MARSPLTPTCRRNSCSIRAVGSVDRNRFLQRASIDHYALTVFPDGRAIVAGTDDPAIAKSVYARYVGS